jgi:chromosome segregation ATPase
MSVTEYEIMREQMLEMKSQRDEWIETYKHFRDKVAGWVQDHEGMVAKVMALQQERDAWMRKWQELDSAPVPSAAEHHRVVEECRRRLQEVIDLKARLATAENKLADVQRELGSWHGMNAELHEKLVKLRRKVRRDAANKPKTKRRRAVRTK